MTAMNAPATRRTACGWTGTAARHRGGRAFTLIEIMVVVAIMALVLMMGIPAIYSAWHHDPLTQAVVDVTEACKRARAQAILSGNTTAMRIYPRERRITVDAAEAPRPKPEDEQTQDDAPAKAPEGFSAQISNRLDIRMLDVNFLDCSGWDMAVVYFNANGTCDEFNIIMDSETGEARRITLDIATAIPDVVIIR